ncbi:phosphotransferase [Streptomyces sp. TRM66268-LWL]|uniref:Phosphotransferase n=1 Tax=Streptomyces polyasparticus TaxID=2767826 RepID=A0ABR7SJ75_9ACTN|nr:aminoglycoside phosphotransferase family protein [Streptomyces polyasparticus]MBC9715551.1 phosphotransferase [Streptomyces polyasparticus]
MEIPAIARSKALSLGERGREWIDSLPVLVRDIERAWAVTVGEPLVGGTAAYVARVRTSYGEDAVLKLAVPDDGFAGQARALRLARGQGYVRLLRHDEGRNALLLEALGDPLDQLAGAEEQLDVLAALLQQAWAVPLPPADGPFENKARSLYELVNRLWHELGRPCPEPVVAKALAYAERRARFGPGDCVLVHGDPHPGNALRTLTPREGAGTGYVFVDPEGFLAPPAYDLGVVLREWCAELLAAQDPVRLARGYCARLAAATGEDETAVWEWGFLERVSSGLYCLAHGAPEIGRPFLQTAGLLVREG